MPLFTLAVVKVVTVTPPVPKLGSRLPAAAQADLLPTSTPHAKRPARSNGHKFFIVFLSYHRRLGSTASAAAIVIDRCSLAGSFWGRSQTVAAPNRLSSNEPRTSVSGVLWPQGLISNTTPQPGSGPGHALTSPPPPAVVPKMLPLASITRRSSPRNPPSAAPWKRYRIASVNSP